MFTPKTVSLEQLHESMQAMNAANPIPPNPVTIARFVGTMIPMAYNLVVYAINRTGNAPPLGTNYRQLVVFANNLRIPLHPVCHAMAEFIDQYTVNPHVVATIQPQVIMTWAQGLSEFYNFVIANSN